MIKELWAGLPLRWRGPKTGSERIERLLVFLGNPGPEYRRSRHNLGFMVGERLLELQNGASFREAVNGRFWAGSIGSRYVGILLPGTFMNASGQSAARAADRCHVDVSQIVVIYDDMDLDFGLLRIRVGGSSGGHLGVKSTIDELGNPDFVRVRMGVGRPPKSVDPVDFLLDDFSPSEQAPVSAMIDSAAAAIVDLLHRPTDVVMNEVNGRSIDI